jgi:hypothetical protein
MIRACAPPASLKVKGGEMTGSNPWLQVEIRVKGQIDRDWSDWLDDLAVAHSEDGNTILSGAVRDQAALYGLLSQLSDMGLSLISLSSTGFNPGRQGGIKMHDKS